ncbi:MAG: FG-GAP repeat protein, partial [Phycisphaerales bacterium]|nr:FG-GAP repeat protein [Phycisphaerales bacterium]
MAARGVLYFLLLAISSGVYGQDVTETKLTTFDWAAGDQFGRSVAISGGYAVVGAWLDDDNGSNSGSAYICERDGLGNWNEVQKLTASDGAENDRFGLSVSISGDYAVIGAYEEDDNYSSGSAYIFERDGAGSWNEVQKLTASDGAENDRFGRSVSISGEYAVIGADLAHGNDFYSGGAYIFDRDGDGNWNEVAKLTASDGAYNDRFGWSVSISGDYAVIGAIGGGYNGTWSGSAYIFEHDRDGNWTEVNKLTASDGAAEDYFGGSVSISGNYAVIGAYGDDDDGSYSASAYVFERDGAGVWSEAQKLTASDAAAGDYFGYSVSISGDYAVIGAGWDDDNGYSSGSAYVYERDGQGNWSEAAKLIASDGAGYDNFGRSVAISGGYAVVGAPDDDDKGTNSGSAYIFDRDGDGDWIQSAKQTSPADDDFFGGSVSISGEYAVVGAGWDDDNGSSSGSAYVYERDGAGNWNEVQKLTASDGAAEDYFGFSVSISGDYAVIGAPHDDDTGPDSGSAYIFERDGLGNWNEVQKLIASDGDAEDYFGGSVSISGNYVVIGSRSRLNISSESAYVFERDELGNWSEVQKLTASDGASGDLFGVSVAISGGYAVVGAVYDDGNGSRSGSAYVFERDGAGNWFEAAKLIASDGAEWDIFGESVSISGDDAVIGA